MTEDSSAIKCGCGFSAAGPDQKSNREAFDVHTCFDGDVQATTWYHALFSLWGAATLFVIGYVVVQIVKAVQ